MQGGIPVGVWAGLKTDQGTDNWTSPFSCPASLGGSGARASPRRLPGGQTRGFSAGARAFDCALCTVGWAVPLAHLWAFLLSNGKRHCYEEGNAIAERAVSGSGELEGGSHTGNCLQCLALMCGWVSRGLCPCGAAQIGILAA